MSGKKTVSLMAIALALGLIGAGLAMLYLKAREADLIDALKPKSAPISVVVASRDLLKGDVLDSSTLAVRSIPEEYVDNNAIKPNEFDKFQGEKIIQNLDKGKPLLRSYIAREYPLDFSDTITQKRRAMTIQIDETNSQSGLMRPGNKVDIFVNLPPTANVGTSSKGNQVMPVLENVEVLATGRDTAKDYEEKVRLLRGGRLAQPDQNYTTITLNVTPKEGALLTIAQEKGELLALLRNRKDMSGSGFTRVGTDTIQANATALAAAAVARENAKPIGSKLSMDKDGNVITADGTVLRGAKLNKDGKLVLSDGTIVDPKDVIIGADGKVMTKDGKALAGVSASKGLSGLKTDSSGNVITKDGIIIPGAKLNKDGKLVLANGAIIDPKNVTIAADGTMRTKDGKLILSDGSIVDPKDVTINADGTVTTKDGRVLKKLTAGRIAGALTTDENGNIVTASGAIIKGATLQADGKLKLADGTIVDPNQIIVNADGSITTKDGKVIDGLVADTSSASGIGYEVDYIVGGVSEDGVATVKKVPVVE